MKKVFKIVIFLSFLAINSSGYSKGRKRVKLKDLSIPSKSKDFQEELSIQKSGRIPQSIESESDEETKLRHRKLREFSERMLDLRDRK